MPADDLGGLKIAGEVSPEMPIVRRASWKANICTNGSLVLMVQAGANAHQHMGGGAET
jgi:hypothetical protein